MDWATAGSIIVAIIAAIGAWASYRASRKNNQETLKATPYDVMVERIVYLENADQAKSDRLREQAAMILALTRDRDHLVSYIKGLHDGLQKGIIPPWPGSSELPEHLRPYIPPLISEVSPPDADEGS